MKSVRHRSFSDPHFPAFGLNTQRYGVSLRIQSECRKIRTRKIPNKETNVDVIEFVLYYDVFLSFTSRGAFLVPLDILQITFKKDVFINLLQTMAHKLFLITMEKEAKFIIKSITRSLIILRNQER